MKKVLIISMTVGAGHNKIAKYYETKLDKKIYETKIVQLYGKSQKQVEKEDKKFQWLVNHIPKTYNFFWQLAVRRPNFLRYFPSFMSIGVRKTINYVENQIKEYNPDFIISTHFYASSVLCKLRRKKRLNNNIKIYQVVTDFCLVPYYENIVLVDKLIIPSEILKNDFKKKGFKDDQFLIYKYPNKIEPPLKTKEEIKTKLNLNTNKPIIIHSTGAASKYSTIKLLKYISNNYFYINICGKNKKEFNKVNKYLEKKNIKNVLNLGFVSNMNELIYISDCAITSGSTQAFVEFLTLKKPLIFRPDAIINEKGNGFLISKNNLGRKPKRFKKVEMQIDYILKNYESYQENIDKFNKSTEEFRGIL